MNKPESNMESAAITKSAALVVEVFLVVSTETSFSYLACDHKRATHSPGTSRVPLPHPRRAGEYSRRGDHNDVTQAMEEVTASPYRTFTDLLKTAFQSLYKTFTNFLHRKKGALKNHSIRLRFGR